SGLFRFTATERLPRASWSVEPAPTLSTRTTSAPKSARISPQKGAGASPAISITRIPCNALIPRFLTNRSGRAQAPPCCCTCIGCTVRLRLARMLGRGGSNSVALVSDPPTRLYPAPMPLEFGVFQGASVGPRPWDVTEPLRIRRDIEVGIAADAAGFDTYWAPEHHCLEEYSHGSSSHLACLAVGVQTNR